VGRLCGFATPLREWLAGSLPAPRSPGWLALADGLVLVLATLGLRLGRLLPDAQETVEVVLRDDRSRGQLRTVDVDRPGRQDLLVVRAVLPRHARLEVSRQLLRQEGSALCGLLVARVLAQVVRRVAQGRVREAVALVRERLDEGDREREREGGRARGLRGCGQV